MTQAEASFLRVWAHEEVHNVQGPAHELQKVHGAKTADLAARFRAWTTGNRWDPITVTKLIDHPVTNGPLTWPWSCKPDCPDEKTSQLRQFTADHRYLLETVARQAGFADPVSLDAASFLWPLLSHARKKMLLEVDGVLVRDWSSVGRGSPGTQLGLCLYEMDGIPFVVVNFPFTNHHHHAAFHFIAVDRKNHRQLYRHAVRCAQDIPNPSSPPILPAEQTALLWNNTIGYLDQANLSRIRAYGGRPRRGVLLTGSPGNGKTMACRWLWDECRRRNWEWKLITPDDYHKARANQTVNHLFSVHRRGILFFDDMDLALRDRETVHETDDQSIFLTALDGIATKDGIVFVFTTNCPLDLIDRAFKRPGRIDVALHLQSPNADLRRDLINRWHAEIKAIVDIEKVITTTEGCSFAEMEELKNLLIMHYMDSGEWDWTWALEQFAINRQDLAPPQDRNVGFHAPSD
jgi:hypothetical protein